MDSQNNALSCEDDEYLYLQVATEGDQAETLLVNRKKEDDRVPVDWMDTVPGHIYGVGQFKSSLYGNPKLGTGILRQHQRQDGKMIFFVQTCAHNICGPKNAGKMKQITDGAFVMHKDGNESYKGFKMVAFYVPEEYNGDPDCGFDYGIAIVEYGPTAKEKNWNNEHYSFRKDYNAITYAFDLEQAQEAKDATIHVTGYPGDKAVKGAVKAYTASGKVLELEKNLDTGGCVVRYDVVTERG